MKAQSDNTETGEVIARGIQIDIVPGDVASIEDVGQRETMEIFRNALSRAVDGKVCWESGKRYQEARSGSRLPIVKLVYSCVDASINLELVARDIAKAIGEIGGLQSEGNLGVHEENRRTKEDVGSIKNVHAIDNWKIQHTFSGKSASRIAGRSK